MARMNLAVEISFNKVGKGEEVAIRSVKQIGDEAERAGGAADSLAESFSGVAAAIGATALAWKGLDILKGMISQGIQFNATVESATNGLAGQISAMTQISDAQGKVLEGQQKFDAAMKISAGVLDDVRTAALQTSASYENMVEAIGVALGPALGAKLKLANGEIVKFVQTVTQMAGAINLPFDQLGQEIRGILEGDTSKNSRLGQILYGDVKDPKKTVDRLKEEGKFYDWVMGKMEAYRIAGERASKTFSGALSNLKDAFQQALGEGTQGQLGAVTSMMLDLTEKLVTFDETGKATFNQDFVNGIEAITSAFTRLAEGVVGFITKIDDLTVKWRALKALADEVKDYAPGAVGGLRQANEGAFGGTYGSLLKTIIDPTAIPKAINTWTWEKVSGMFNEKVAEIKAADSALQASADSALRSLGKSVADRVGLSALGAKEAAGVWGGNQYAFGGGLTPDAFYQKVGAFTKENGAQLPALIKAINAEAKNGTLTLAEFNAALRAMSNGGFNATGKPGSGKTEISKSVVAEMKREADLLAKITADTSKSVDLGLLRLNVIRATTDEAKRLAEYTLRTKEIELREQSAIAQVAGLKHASEAQRLTAIQQLRLKFQGEWEEITAEFQADQDEAARKSQEETHKQGVADALDLLEKQMKAAEESGEYEQKVRQEVLEKARKQFEQFYGSVGAGLKNAMASALDGGGLRGMFDNFFGSVFETVGENFAKQIDGWVTLLSDMASGQRKTGRTNPDGSPEYEKFDWGKKGKYAQGGMLALQAGSALYGMYTNPAPKKSQNMLGGAMAGASIGFQYGSMTGNPYAMIVGAVVGAIIGAFAPTEEGKNVKIMGDGGRVVVTGMDSGWGTEKLLKSINTTINSTAAKLDEIFISLPTAALKALGDWRPDLSKIDVSGKADGKNWNEELDNYLKETLPARVFGMYGGAITGALKFAGATDKKIKEFYQYLATLNTDEAIKAVSDYVGLLYGFAEIMDKYFAGKGAPGKQRAANRFTQGQTFEAKVYAFADRGPLAEFGDISERVAALSQGFDKLTHEEQVTRGKQILDLSNQFFQGMEQYLLHLRDMQRAMNDSVNAQIRDINYDQIKDPKAKVEFIQDEQRRLYDQLGQAKTADEVNRIMAQIQRNAGVLYDLLGRTPEAAETAKKQLEAAQELANKQYAIFHENAQKMIDEAYKLVDDILKRLQNGLIKAGIPAEPPDGGGTGDTGKDDGNGNDNANALSALGLAATGTAANLDAFTPSIADATAKILAFSAALQTPPPVNVTVNMAAPEVQVNLAGTAERLIDEVSARSSPAIVSQVVSTMERRYARSAMTGRR